jgi:drug/metabolite transporter (DMT)-like permease
MAWLLWFHALSRLPAGVAGLGTLDTPVVGVLTGWTQFGDIQSCMEIIGMILIIDALILNSKQAIRFANNIPDDKRWEVF